jgi:hypothetical protein
MNRSAVVEIWPGETLLYIPELPGFRVNAASPDHALRHANDRIERFLKWLEEGELAESVAPAGVIDITEQRAADGNTGPLFEADREQAGADHREFALSVGRAALPDLLFVFDDLDQAHRPAATQTLRHVAEMDRWYATRLAPASGQPFAAIEDELVQSASLFEETIDGLPDEDAARVWAIDGEQWTIRKALRRRTGHLREHLVDLLALSA